MGDNVGIISANSDKGLIYYSGAECPVEVFVVAQEFGGFGGGERGLPGVGRRGRAFTAETGHRVSVVIQSPHCWRRIERAAQFAPMDYYLMVLFNSCNMGIHYFYLSDNITVFPE